MGIGPICVPLSAIGQRIISIVMVLKGYLHPFVIQVYLCADLVAQNWIEYALNLQIYSPYYYASQPTWHPYKRPCHVMTDSTDMEIYQDTMDARAACENLKINGSNDLDEGTSIELWPTQHDVLNTTYTIGKYISDINVPDSHKIEALLSSINGNSQHEQTRDLKSTTTTDFFKPCNYFSLCPTFL